MDFFDRALDFFNGINDFINYAWAWLYTGVYEFVKDCFVFLTKIIIYSMIQGAIFSAQIAAEVVSDISADLGVTQYAQSAYNNIPADMRATLDFFGVPQALTIILSAIPTRMVMRFIPFIGR